MFVDSKLDDNDEFTPKFMSSPDRLRNGRISSWECEREVRTVSAQVSSFLFPQGKVLYVYFIFTKFRFTLHP